MRAPGRPRNCAPDAASRPSRLVAVVVLIAVTRFLISNLRVRAGTVSPKGRSCARPLSRVIVSPGLAILCPMTVATAAPVRPFVTACKLIYAAIASLRPVRRERGQVRPGDAGRGGACVHQRSRSAERHVPLSAETQRPACCPRSAWRNGAVEAAPRARAAVYEELLDRGVRGDAHDPGDPLAHGLATSSSGQPAGPPVVAAPLAANRRLSLRSSAKL